MITNKLAKSGRAYYLRVERTRSVQVHAAREFMPGLEGDLIETTSHDSGWKTITEGSVLVPVTAALAKKLKKLYGGVE